MSFFVNSVQSPVLEKMFQNKFKESSENRMNIKDFEYDVVMQMLEYLYTGKARKLNEHAEKLLTVADMVSIFRDMLLFPCSSGLFSFH